MPGEMSTVVFIEHLLTIANEVIFPALALWLAYLVRKWLTGQLETPPYEHKVSLQPPPGVAPPLAGPTAHGPIDHHGHR